MAALLIAAVLAWSLRSGAPAAPRAAQPAATASIPNQPQRLKVKVLATRHHDPAAFTQGLLVHGGSLYESTGLYGSSSVREVDLITGAVKRKADVPSQYFAEGLALVDDRLIQLTWKEHKALVYQLAGF
ncbi:MAG TPA: glutaminyl-peptide cyclotransferase, partial [Thermoanaerobaculia bacterium]|nr:glutaminyl-peptide cyclotransferase [Thermoanaerobaculia bacterium]